MSSDYQLEDTLNLPFTTRAFATGIPTTLAGTPAIDIYEDATPTPIITGETLSVDHNSVAGYNMITVTATAATGFEAGKSYTAIIQAGTVDGVSAVGEVVGQFTIARSAAAKDLANATDGLGAIKAQTAAIETDTGVIGAAGAGLTAIPLDADWINGGRLDLLVDAIKLVTDTVVSDVWDEILTGATHNIATSAGRRLRGIDAAFEVASGTAQAGGANQITLAAGESAVNDIFKGDRIIIVGGTGVGEHAIVTAYNGTTKVALTTPAWVTTPDATSEYEVVPASVNLETVDGTAQTAGDLAALIVALNDLSAAAVNAEVANVLKIDTITLPGQAAPPLTPTFEQAIGHMFKVYRNAKKQSGTEWQLLADDEVTVDQKATVSDAAGVATKGEIAAGP